MKTKTYTFYSDPSHAWLKVPKSEVEQLGIAEKISTCSYKNGAYLYLEEDCDAPLFIEAQKSQNIEVKFKESSTNRTSKIRSYPRFTDHITSFIDDVKANDLAHEIWAAAQLRLDEGIEDGVERIKKLLK